MERHLTPASAMPPTITYLERHARATPDRVAFMASGTTVRFGRFFLDILRFTRGMQALGLSEGQMVAVCNADPYLHLLILLACENLGVVTGTIAMEEPEAEVAFILGLADLVVSERRFAAVPAERWHPITAEWIRPIFALDEAALDGLPRRHHAPEAPLRIGRTSGTTGGQKHLMMRHRMQETWCRNLEIIHRLTGESRYVVMYSFTTNTPYMRAMTVLRLGGAAIYGAPLPVLRAVPVTHIGILARDLSQLLQALPADFAVPGPLFLSMSGSVLPPELREEARRRLGATCTLSYGTNETGSVAVVDEDGGCRALPGSEVRILDEDGAEIREPGVAGTVLAWTEAFTEGYLDNAEATARNFRDGCFVSGDAGEWLPDGRFRILGRQDDLLNVGGLKMAPATIESAIAPYMAGAREFAVTTAPDAEGVEALCILAAFEEGVDVTALTARLHAALPAWAGKPRVVVVPALPATPTGKLQRGKLRALALGSIG